MTARVAMTELEAAQAEYDRALAAVNRTCECCGQYKPLAVFFDPAVRAANERIERAYEAALAEQRDA